jgi:hypothetical protein
VFRRQASLYLPDSTQIEFLRQLYNPTQARLIPAHVTLCREDEVTDWNSFQERLESLVPFAIAIEFGPPIRDDNLVFLPVRNGADEFHKLRRLLLMDDCRELTPHVTIIHPRNGICTDEIFADICAQVSPFHVTIREVMLIEQEDGGIWKLVERIGTAD